MINIHIQSEFLEFVGLDQKELEEIHLNSKDEKEFVKNLWIEECIDHLDLNQENSFELREEVLSMAYKQYKLLEEKYQEECLLNISREVKQRLNQLYLKVIEFYD